MDLVRINTVAHADFKEAMDLYSVSFPVYEQRRLEEQEQVMPEAGYHFNLLYEDEKFIGLLLFWQHDEFIYVEHFCTLPKLRGQGYGQRILSELAKLGKTIILEIDPPNDELSLRRQRFYERAGYVANEFGHVHPPYRAEYAGHALFVMSYPQPLSLAAYHSFNEYLRYKVMLYAEK